MEMVRESMDFVKDSIKGLKGYIPNNVICSIKLDANEGKCKAYKDLCKNINIDMSLYPDDEYKDLKDKIKDYVNAKPSNIVVGNGSSELVELIIKTFVDKDEVILSFVPTFSMYEVFATVNSAQFVGVECNEDISVNIDNVIEKAKEVNPKLIFLCNPNNPTGYLMKKEEIIKVIENTDCIVVCDEAYIEFADTNESMIDEILNYDRLIVLRTFSKAFSLAALRVGYMVANENLATIIDTVRPPYNLNVISQYIATKAVEDTKPVLEYVKIVKKERNFLMEVFENLNIKAYESGANFIYFASDIENLSQKLIDEDVLIRSFGSYYRVTIGDENENLAFAKALKAIVKKEKL
ncbi:histidinol-phosphate transaminase [Romboutsia sp.]|uniref:histidinol-phosphate transaminase n=1 Tax=Romboutsia sp. TaxID=1965302 RepID=UPI003F2CA56B